MTKYYSQNGEDFILHKIFRGKRNGFFVEVGCIDGKRFSNTLSFEERGWKGLCVEAHSGYIELLKKNRPNSIVCYCAVGEKDEESVKFYANSRGSLSTLDPSQESSFREKYGEYFTGFEEQQVPKRRLDTIFENNNITRIDILSLDIEGYEIEALKGLDLDKYRPLVLVVEADSPEHERQLDNLLYPKGYLKSVTIGTNIFYLIDPAMKENIENKIFETEVVHTEHPLDNNGDKHVPININTKKTNPKRWRVLKKLFHKVIRKNCFDYNKRLLSSFFDEGFHGDKYLLQLVDRIIADCNYFIETGTNVGSTLAYVARTYSGIQCFSCEPDKASFEEAVKNTSSFSNVHIYNKLSQEFIEIISFEKKELFNENTFFWLDAHGDGFEWPLKEELNFITTEFKSAYILIDDFKVPGLDCFGYDKYEEQVCSFDYVKDALNSKIQYNLYYPNYREKTSKHHPLRGWGMIEFGHDKKLEIPKELKDKIRKAI